MEKLHFDFIGNDTKCYAEIELNGAADSWRAKAKITGHPTIKTLNITYRLGDYLSPMFVSKEDLLLFATLIAKLTEKAMTLLPNEYETGI